MADPCLPTPAPLAHHAARHAAAAHRVVGRIRHRTHPSQFHAVPPREAAGCGKHFLPGQPGALAMRPTDPAIAAPAAKAAGLAGLVKAGAAPFAAAAVLAGFLSMPGAGSTPGGDHLGFRGPGDPGSARLGPPSDPGRPPGGISDPGGGVAVPEPASGALFAAGAGFVVWVGAGRTSFLKKRSKKLLGPVGC